MYNVPEYKQLVEEWSLQKLLEQEANTRRLEVEGKLLAIIGKDLRESGTNNFPNNLKVLTGLNATCDKEKVQNLYIDWKATATIDRAMPDFPFKMKWEPDLKRLEEIRKFNPNIYNQYIADCVTIKPKKPAFEVKKGK